jgi:transposase
MRVLYGRCAGLDVHKQTVVACVMTSTATGTASQEVRTFGTMTHDLEALSAWLAAAHVEQVAIESTGVYWWPVFNILEEAGLAVTLVNPQHTKGLPGHKTDVGDAVWLTDLLRHGLVRASFIPPAEIRALRELTRYRATQVRARAREVHHLLKTLESANITDGGAVSRGSPAGTQGPHPLARLLPPTLVTAEVAIGRGALPLKTDDSKTLATRLAAYPTLFHVSCSPRSSGRLAA